MEMLERAEVVLESGLSYVFVPAVEGGVDRDWLARRVAEASVAIYDALLELE